MDVKESIILKSRDIGLDVIGFTSCRPFFEIVEILRERESNGYLSGFEETDIEKRTTPELLLKECRTIISAGISYNTTKSKVMTDGGFMCSISRSSWGEDYHHVLKDKLLLLLKFIEENLNGTGLVFVDTGPLAEREAARRAGIGYIGKNCSLINPDFGSFLFLGEILINIFIEPDEPLKDGCGDCDLCIKACPSGALLGPYTVNAKRCMSYITQSRDIEPEYTGKMGMNLYGCDICQDVCPKNKRALVSTHKEFIPEEWNARPNASDILEMDNRKYNDTFKKTSSGWRGKKILQRNAVIALGNSKNKDAAVILRKMLNDCRREIREVSILALVNLLGNESKEVLKVHLESEKDEHVKKMLAGILDKM